MILIVECEVGADIFETEIIKQRINELFNKFQGKIDARYKKIVMFLKHNSLIIDETEAYNHICEHFRGYLYKEVLNEAITYAFSKDKTYNVIDSLLQLLTEKKFCEYIMGSPMINAFERYISELPDRSTLDGTLNRAKVTLLKMEYLKVLYV